MHRLWNASTPALTLADVAESGVPARGSVATFESQPAVLLAWGLLTLMIVAYTIGIDRTFIIDQDNYLDDFASAVTLDWVHASGFDDPSVKSLLVGVFSEEVVWQCWATVLGLVLLPAAAIVVTTCVLNLLIAGSIRQLPNPALALLLWILVPAGLATTGLSQMRQGLGLAVMLFITLRFSRPVLATLLASAIHTTFILALPFVVVTWLCRRRYGLALLLAVGGAVITAYLGGALFETFGGRRVHTYNAADTEATSILYVFGGLLCGLPSLYRLLTEPPPDETPDHTRALANLAMVHVGVVAFTVSSFFVFPLGAGRVGYLNTLLLIPILPAVRRNDRTVGGVLFALLLLYVVYLTIKSCFDGSYSNYFTG